MADFALRFFLSNIPVSVMIGFLFAARYFLKNSLTSRMQYHMWFWLLGLLTVPFWPFRVGRTFSFLTWFKRLGQASGKAVEAVGERSVLPGSAAAAGWMNDFGISVSRKAPSGVGTLLCILWVAGMLFMVAGVIKAFLRFRALWKSSLPLQNAAVSRLYSDCLTEMKIKRRIPIRSTAFLKSPVIAGFWKPCVYLPIHLISDCPAKDIRYMLLHELQHYKHKDALINDIMNIAGIVYWFNPFVWYALREMRNDREVACDTSVLQMLSEDIYEDYGHTLLNFTEKVSLTTFPFATGISGNMKQMTRRILNIANYRPVSFGKKMRSALAYTMIVVFLVGAVPAVSVRAFNDDCYEFAEEETVIPLDCSRAFAGYEGCFVLYDMTTDRWQIYNQEAALKRISPASTFKIYSALFGLESGAVTSEQTLIPWDGQAQRYEPWNADQTLESAMQNSVTWYFQTLDARTGLPAIEAYIREMGYGNQAVGKNVSSYWMDSTLKISPVEQVEMLQKLYDNQFDFLPENIESVRKAICLYTSEEAALYGKTGTEEMNGENISGWFVGYLEKDGRVYFFATNIQSMESGIGPAKEASGPVAAQLTFSILSDLNL